MSFEDDHAPKVITKMIIGMIILGAAEIVEIYSTVDGVVVVYSGEWRA